VNIGDDGMTYPLKGTGRNPTEPINYEIHIKEPLDSRWVSWFEGMTMYQAIDGETVISGTVVDKSALHGLLAMIGELNLTLLSVRKLESLNLPTGGNHEK
jgi:hypothetical protein